MKTSINKLNLQHTNHAVCGHTCRTDVTISVDALTISIDMTNTCTIIEYLHEIMVVKHLDYVILDIVHGCA